MGIVAAAELASAGETDGALAARVALTLRRSSVEQSAPNRHDRRSTDLRRPVTTRNATIALAVVGIVVFAIGAYGLATVTAGADVQFGVSFAALLAGPFTAVWMAVRVIDGKVR